jgi:excisionase family DNA binding protein
VEEQTRSLSEVAGLMGVSERTVRRWIKSGRLKAYKPGRDYRIPESGLRAFIEESEISPKVPAPLSLQPSFNDVLAEERRPESREGSDEERRFLLALLGTLTELMSELSDYYHPRLDNLPEEPPLDEIVRYQWVVDCLNTCLIVERRFDEEDFLETVGPWVGRVDAGEQVPPDINQKVRAFQNAWTRWVVDVPTVALDWIRRQKERIGEASAEFSAELDRLDSEQELSTSRWAEGTAWRKSAE